MSLNEEISSKERHTLKKSKSKLISHAPLLLEESGDESDPKTIVTNEENVECKLEKKKVIKREIVPPFPYFFTNSFMI